MFSVILKMKYKVEVKEEEEKENGGLLKFKHPREM